MQITATDSDGDTLTFSAGGLPASLPIDGSTGLISGAPAAPGTGQAIVNVTDGEETGLAAFNWTVSGTAPLAVEPMQPQVSRLAGSTVTYTASTTGGVNVRYKWQFGDGTPETALSDSASTAHVFGAPGIYFVTLTVTDDVASPFIQQFVQTIHLPLTTRRAALVRQHRVRNPHGRQLARLGRQPRQQLRQCLRRRHLFAARRGRSRAGAAQRRDRARRARLGREQGRRHDQHLESRRA